MLNYYASFLFHNNAFMLHIIFLFIKNIYNALARKSIVCTGCGQLSLLLNDCVLLFNMYLPQNILRKPFSHFPRTIWSAVYTCNLISEFTAKCGNGAFSLLYSWAKKVRESKATTTFKTSSKSETVAYEMERFMRILRFQPLMHRFITAGVRDVDSNG